MADSYVALLRGINVGTTKRMLMADLRALLVKLGYGEPRTLLQSGNVAFHAEGPAAAIEARIAKGLLDRFGFDVRVLVRSRRELRGIVTRTPFPEAESEGSLFHVAFLSAKPKASALEGVDEAAFAPERFAVAGREIYMWCRNGVRESKLFTTLSDKRLGVAVTVRNWNTVTKLLALAEA
jgi:uncharacterized protein (DUF1697 family)